MNLKHCKECGQHKPLNDFYVCRGTPRERCKACVISRAKAQYRANPERAKALVVACRLADPRVRMASDTRRRDRARGLASDIEASHIVIPDVCPVLGIPMRTQTGQPAEESPSIDHINPDRGAIWGNWRVISRRANALKAGHTAETLRAYIAAIGSGAKALRGRVTLDEYRAVLGYLESHRAA